MVYALKTQRITTKKLPKDRFLTCQIHPSSEEKEGYSGCLFSLIEIDTKQSVSQIGHSIINTTAREYFRGTHTDVAENFELSLKKTNDILANYTQEGQTDWIGNLHGLIALIYKDEIHLTCVGKSYALLIRDGKMINITPETNDENEDIHPLCTFSNITSGPLEKNDVILIASQNIFSHIDKKELRQLIELNSIEDASIELAHILSEEKIFDTNVLLIETTTKEDIANEPLSSAPESIYLDELNDSFFRRLRLFHQKSLKPALKKTHHSCKKNARSIYHWTKEKKILQKLKHSSIILKPILPALQKLSKKLPAFQKSQESSPNVKINHYSRLHSLNLKKLPRYPTIIGILLIILIISLFIKLRPHESKKTIQKNNTSPINNIDTSSLQTKFNLAKSASDKEAINILQEIIKSLDNKKLTSQQSDLLSQTESRYNTLTSSETLTIPSPKITLPEKNLKIAILENIIYAFGQTNIYKGQINQSKLSSTIKVASTDGVISSIAGPTSTKTFYITTSRQKILEYIPTKNQLTEVKSTEPWKNATSIANFNTNIYLLDNQTNQIWKYVLGTNGSYGKAAGYLSTPNEEISELPNLTIDSILYGIEKNGQVYAIKKSGLTQIPLTKLPSPKMQPQNPISLTTSSENSYFFITEPARLTLIDKQGKYYKQFNLKGATIKNIFVQPILKKAWIATDQALFSFNY